MVQPPRLSSEARRVEILEAVQRVFAEQGFHGTTTRVLAEAAGVSEALIYKYFPTKELLYTEVLAHVCRHCEEDRARYRELAPSTSTLVILVHHMVRNLALPPEPAHAHSRTMHNRLMLQSLLADGEFARQFLAIISQSLVGTLARCIEAATAAGDCDAPLAGPEEAMLRAWSTTHTAVLAALYALPPQPVVDYHCEPNEQVAAMVRFSLRGAGLSQEAILRHYQPQALAFMDS